MPEIHAQVSIDRSREDVYDYISNPDTQAVWQSNLVEFTADDWQGEAHVGDRSQGAIKVAGRRVGWTAETTEARRPERFAFRSVEAPFPFEFSFTLTDRGGSTELSYQGSTKTMGGFFGKLADPLVARMYERDMKANLENLKEILEGG